MKKKKLNKFQFGGYVAPNYGIDYATQFALSTKPLLSQSAFDVGLATSNSSNPMIALRGKSMRDNAINGTNNAQITPQNTPNMDWTYQNISSNNSAAQNVLNAGTNIYRSAQNLNSLKGLSGVGSLKAGNIGSIVGSAADLVGTFLPEKQEYSGPKGDITQTMDSVYDGISNAAMSLGPIGSLVGGIMKGGALLGKGMNALGGGTDGLTTTDAILGSSFLNLTPIGLINGFGGSKANTITKDDSAFEKVGASYTGSNQTVNDALQKSGKKYGLFSQNAKNKANREIADARNQQYLISNIADDATTRFGIRNSMSAINGNRRAFNMQGGYNQALVQVGKQGLKISPQQARKIFNSIKSTFKERKEIPLTEEFIFLQDEARIESEKKPIKKNKEGGSLIESDIEITIPETIPEFQKGGSINVIPDGALHARKHNMDIEGITKKGIPVIDNDDNQQAEIEKEELIFRLEVTQKIEEMEKKYSSKETKQKEKDELSLEAGKLLTEEILHNTQDNTNNILNGKKN